MPMKYKDATKNQHQTIEHYSDKKKELLKKFEVCNKAHVDYLKEDQLLKIHDYLLKEIEKHKYKIYQDALNKFVDKETREKLKKSCDFS